MKKAAALLLAASMLLLSACVGRTFGPTLPDDDDWLCVGLSTYEMPLDFGYAVGYKNIRPESVELELSNTLIPRFMWEEWCLWWYEEIPANLGEDGEVAPLSELTEKNGRISHFSARYERDGEQYLLMAEFFEGDDIGMESAYLSLVVRSAK